MFITFSRINKHLLKEISLIDLDRQRDFHSRARERELSIDQLCSY
jgi:hypothetical protein